MKFKTTLALFGVGLSAMGCSVDMDAQGPEAAAGVEVGHSDQELAALKASEDRTLATIEVPTGTVDFFVGADGVAGFGETTSADIRETPVEAAAAAGNFTTLELYLALSNEPAPQELIDSHAIEAEALGRSNDDLQALDIDVDAPVEKSPALCDSATRTSYYNTYAENKWDNYSGHYYFWLGYTTWITKLSWCNDSATTLSRGYFKSSGLSNYQDQYVYLYRVSPGQRTYLVKGAVYGNGQTWSTQYKLIANGTDYHTRIAWVSPVVR